MRWILLLLVLMFQSSERYGWMADLEPITPENIERLQLLAVFNGVSSFVVSPDGHYLAYTENNRVMLFDTRTGLNTSYFGNGRLVFSPDSTRLAFADGSASLRVLNLQTGQVQESFPFEPRMRPYELQAITPDNTRIVVSVNSQIDDGSANRYAGVFDIATGERLARGGLLGNYDAVSISPDGRFYAFQGFKEVELYDLTTGEEIARVPNSPNNTSPDLWLLTDRHLVTHDFETVLIFDLQTHQTVEIDSNVLSGYYRPIRLEDNRLIALTTDRGILQEFDVTTAEEISHVEFIIPDESAEPPQKIFGTTINRDLTMMATVEGRWDFMDGDPTYLDSLIFWDVETGSPLHSIPLSGAEPMGHVEFSADDRFILTGNRLWGVVPESYRLPVIEGTPPNWTIIDLLPTTLQCESSPPSQLNWGYTATAVESLKVRAVPDGEQVGSLEIGEQVRLITPPVCGEDGLLWWGIQSLDRPELRGWSAESSSEGDYYLTLGQ